MPGSRLPCDSIYSRHFLPGSPHKATQAQSNNTRAPTAQITTTNIQANKSLLWQFTEIRPGRFQLSLTIHNSATKPYIRTVSKVTQFCQPSHQPLKSLTTSRSSNASTLANNNLHKTPSQCLAQDQATHTRAAVAPRDPAHHEETRH